MARLAKKSVMSERRGNKHPTSKEKSNANLLFTEKAYAAKATYQITLTHVAMLAILIWRLRFLKQKMLAKARIVAMTAMTANPQGWRLAISLSESKLTLP